MPNFMESLIIPAILIVFAVLCFWVSLKLWNNSGLLSILGILLCVLFLFSILICPTKYLVSRNTAWKAEQYYNQIILPNVIEEGSDFVIVGNIEAAIWQAGDYNIYDYNSYLVTTRYWQGVFLLGTAIYDVPDHLKYVRVGTSDA